MMAFRELRETVMDSAVCVGSGSDVQFYALCPLYL